MIFAEKPDRGLPMEGAGSHANRQGDSHPPDPSSQNASGAAEAETEMTTTQYPSESAQQDEEFPDPAANREKSNALLRPMGWPGDMVTTGGRFVPGGPQGRILAGPEDCPDGPDGPGLRLDSDNEQRVVLNVGGVRHETRVSTLKAIPNTRLSRLAHTHTQLIQHPSTPSPLLTTPTLSVGMSPMATLLPPTEYFFDRHPAVFNAVIDFYRTGELHVPLEVCGAVVKRELDFWQINEMEIKACCWRHYRSYIENQAILDSFNNSLIKESYSVDIDHLQGWRRFQMRVWLIMDHPRTSKMAMGYGIVSFLFVVISIAGFCLETLPNLRPTVNYNVTVTCHGKEQIIEKVMTSNRAMFVLDVICTIFFTLELIVRFTFSPSKLKFVISPMNIIDLLALVPLYVTVIFQAWNLQACYLNEQFVIEIMFILRIFRMFRIFHLVKHYQALKVLVYALRASLQELLMLFIFLLIAMLVFATMIYYAERQNATQPSEQFNTIPMGFWWAIITMTTVGYGDVSPVTPVGYIVGTACCVVGVLLVALTFPVISNNFTLFYTHVRSRPVKQPPARAHSSSSFQEGGGGGGEGGGVKSKGGSGRGNGTRHDEEEEHLLRSPLSSPSHSGPRKASSGSAVTEPYMNGGMMHQQSSHASPGTGDVGRPGGGGGEGQAPMLIGPHHLYAPALAKFSDSNSMTDIILSRGQGSPGKDSTKQEQKTPPSTCSPRAGSVTSRKAQSDDGMKYQGETRL